MKYIKMLNIEDNEFEVTSATTPEEIKKLGIRQILARVDFGV